MATETIHTASVHAHAATGDHGHEAHLHGGPKMYGGILGILLVLTVITVGASYIHFGSGMANVIIAMIIASIKACLVALFFMHLRWDKPVSAVVFCVSLFFLALFLIGCYTDYAARPPSEPQNMKSAVPPGGIPLQQNQVVPHGAPGASPSGGGPVIPGASPEGNSGGPAAGTAHPTPQVPTHQ